MKKIECFVRENDVNPLVKALSKRGVGGITLYPVQGFGRQKGKGTDALIARVKMEVFALDMELDQVLATIMEVTRKHDFGAGKIAILPVDDVIRIRTGEKGAKAIF
jgi:nitrogen regulatory protein PII